MHSASFAPELSAIFKIDSCWIIAASSLRLFHDLEHAPALQLRERPGLHDPHQIALPGFTRLVVCIELPGAHHALAVNRMGDTTFDTDHDSLVHLVAQHRADA